MTLAGLSLSGCGDAVDEDETGGAGASSTTTSPTAPNEAAATSTTTEEAVATSSGEDDPATEDDGEESDTGGSDADADDSDAPPELASTRWPGDLEGASAVFDQMPASLAGLEAERPEAYGPSDGIFYGSEQDVMSAWVMGPDQGVDDPRAILSVMFGMGMTCLDGTHSGTAPLTQYGVPGMAGPSGDDNLWWFSCDFEGEGAPSPGHAVGWVAGDLGWLVAAPDEELAGQLLETLAGAVE